MSDAVSALSGAEAGAIATIRELGLQGMVTLRGDLSSATLKKAVKAATDHNVPGRRAIRGGLGHGVAWMSPDELMLFCAHDKAEELASLLGQALKGQHHMAVNVSDARAAFAVSGPAAREVMAKLCPVDMAPGRFEPGQIRRTRMAQIPAAIWLAGPEEVNVVCFRSVAQYAFDLLSVAAAEGSAVNHF